MIARFAPIFVLPAIIAIAVRAAFPAEASPAAQEQLVVLRNGEVLSGQVSQQADRYVVVREGTQIRLQLRDVDFVCNSLDEAYNVQHNRVMAGRIDDHLNLADWCLRQKLLGYAAKEITAAMHLDAKNPRVALLDGRLRRALEPEPVKVARSESGVETPQPVSSEELERLVRSLPLNTVENFTAQIQPMLLNYCATAGCHGPSSSSTYGLLRSPLEKVASRRLTERNLYNTLQWIDHESPLDSKLLSAAREPHGPNQASGATGVGTIKYQELVAWVLQASSGGIAKSPASVARNVPPQTAGAPSVLASPQGQTTIAPEGVMPTGSKAPSKIHKLPAVASAKSAAANSKPVPAPPVTEPQSPSAVEQH